jgi:hypothetical protein
MVCLRAVGHLAVLEKRIGRRPLFDSIDVNLAPSGNASTHAAGIAYSQRNSRFVTSVRSWKLAREAA